VSQANFCIPPLARPDLDASAPNEETSAAGRIGLFHHLIGGGEDRLWDRQAEQPGTPAFRIASALSKSLWSQRMPYGTCEKTG
jgi:hypothetical protein